MRPNLAALLLSFAGGAVAAQEPAITSERVAEVLTFLAADEMKGRNSPSPELEQAADRIGEWFETAGLSPGASDSFFHAYELTGHRVTTEDLVVRVRIGERDPTSLRPGADFLLARPSTACDGEWTKATLVRIGDTLDTRRRRSPFDRAPMLLEVAGSDPLWQSAGAVSPPSLRSIRARHPRLWIREGVLPEGEIEVEVSVTSPEPSTEPVPLRNVVGLLRGRSKPEEYVLVTAHYDHVGEGNPVDGDAIYNGADDNATGTTAVVLLAEAMTAGPPPERSVLFVCFSAEEKGLRGSFAFAENPPVPLADIVACVNIEMIGRPPEGGEGQAWITGATYSDFATIAKPVLASADIELIEFPQAQMLFGASDNLPLALEGVVAHSISAGTLHRDYHRPSDEIDRIAFEHMTRVIRGLRGVVHAFADGEKRPSWNEAGRQALDRMRTRRRR